MDGMRVGLLLTALTGCAAVALIGCGTSEEAGDSGAARAGLPGQSAAARPDAKAAAPGVPTSRGGDNSIQTWGLEATRTQRIRITAIVDAFLDARARADWRKACDYLAAEQRQTFRRLVKGRVDRPGCAVGMETLATNVPRSAFVHEAEITEVLSLRLGGGRAFLIYARPNAKIYATALSREGGAWKVVSVGPTLLGKI
jgi:hypothetical protein